MGDIARRRELRKRKILENAELRKQKIFGLCSNVTENSSNDLNLLTREMNSSRSTDDFDETASTKSLESEVSSKSFTNDASADCLDDVTKLREVLRNIPDPLVESEENQAINETLESTSFENSPNNLVSDTQGTSRANSSNQQTSTIYNSSGGSLLSNANDRPFIHTTPSYFWCWLEHPAAPSFLGLIVLLLLSLDLGNLVSNSFIIPFCVWEIQQIIASYTSPEGKEEQSSIIEAALLLCGINKNIISKYIWISKLVKDIIEDFAIYFITIVVLHTVTGFPTTKVKA